MKKQKNSYTKQYDLTLLSSDQINKIYKERTVFDFPPNELKPLDMLHKLVSEGRYECYGVIENEEIIGYSFLNRLGGKEDYLIDYLATIPSVRNCGLGAKILKLLAQKLAGADNVILEVENPEFAINDEDRKLQTRRLNFYLRNGFRDTNVRAECFSVPFIILELENGAVKSEKEIAEIYRQHYKAMLPKGLFDANVFV